MSSRLNMDAMDCVFLLSYSIATVPMGYQCLQPRSDLDPRVLQRMGGLVYTLDFQESVNFIAVNSNSSALKSVAKLLGRPESDFVEGEAIKIQMTRIGTACGVNTFNLFKSILTGDPSSILDGCAALNSDETSLTTSPNRPSSRKRRWSGHLDNVVPSRTRRNVGPSASSTPQRESVDGKAFSLVEYLDYICRNIEPEPIQSPSSSALVRRKIGFYAESASYPGVHCTSFPAQLRRKHEEFMKYVFYVPLMRKTVLFYQNHVDIDHCMLRKWIIETPVEAVIPMRRYNLFMLGSADGELCTPETLNAFRKPQDVSGLVRLNVLNKESIVFDPLKDGSPLSSFAFSAKKSDGSRACTVHACIGSLVAPILAHGSSFLEAVPNDAFPVHSLYLLVSLDGFDIYECENVRSVREFLRCTLSLDKQELLQFLAEQTCAMKGCTPAPIYAGQPEESVTCLFAGQRECTPVPNAFPVGSETIPLPEEESEDYGNSCLMVESSPSNAHLRLGDSQLDEGLQPSQLSRSLPVTVMECPQSVPEESMRMVQSDRVQNGVSNAVPHAHSSCFESTPSCPGSVISEELPRVSQLLSPWAPQLRYAETPIPGDHLPVQHDCHDGARDEFVGRDGFFPALANTSIRYSSKQNDLYETNFFSTQDHGFAPNFPSFVDRFSSPSITTPALMNDSSNYSRAGSKYSLSVFRKFSSFSFRNDRSYMKYKVFLKSFFLVLNLLFSMVVVRIIAFSLEKVSEFMSIVSLFNDFHLEISKFRILA